MENPSKVVYENGGSGDVLLTLTGCKLTSDCLYAGRVFAGPPSLTVTSAMVTTWKTSYVNKANCWCCNSQKRGNGVYTPSSTATRADTLDLGDLKKAWMKYYYQVGYRACSDYDLSGRCDSLDLSRLKKNWLATVGAGPPCL